MTLDPEPIDVVERGKPVQLLPKVDILDGLLVKRNSPIWIAPQDVVKVGSEPLTAVAIARVAYSAASRNPNRLALLRERRGTTDRIALEVVMALGWVHKEAAGLACAGHHLAGPMTRCIDVANGFLGDRALLVARMEYL